MVATSVHSERPSDFLLLILVIRRGIPRDLVGRNCPSCDDNISVVLHFLFLLLYSIATFSETLVNHMPTFVLVKRNRS